MKHLHHTWAAVESAPSDADVSALLELRSAIAPTEVDPVTALRFLRARSLDVAKSKAMLEAYLAWREAEQVDDVLREVFDPEIEAVLAEHFAPRLLRGRDKLDRPVLYCALGGVDVPALAKKGVTVEMLIRRYTRAVEEVRLAVEAADDPLGGHLLIQDLRGCTATKFMRSLQFWRQQAHMAQNYYPEMLGKTCVVRGPPAAAWAVSMIKKFLDRKTADKIELTSCEPRQPLSVQCPEETLAELEADFT